MVFLKSPLSLKVAYLEENDFGEIKNWLNERGISSKNVSFFCNGRKLNEQNAASLIQTDSTVEAVFPVLGGKGGFGSMLRMIGAQIEKTTNKEACRDLSGRRLRDINEETRLKAYVNKKAEREQVEAEKKAAKIEKLRKLVTEGESKHEFNDSKYDKDREAATERVHEAVEQAFSEAKASTSGLKRKACQDPQPSTSGTSQPKALWLGVDLTDSDLDSSSDEEDVPQKKTKTLAVK